MLTTEAKSALFQIDNVTFVMNLSIQKFDLLIMKNGNILLFCLYFLFIFFVYFFVYPKVYSFKVSVNFEVFV